MPTNYIRIPLGLQEFEVLRVKIAREEIRIQIKKRSEYESCPHCGHATGRIHQLHRRTVSDLPIQDHKVTLIVQRRRFYCPLCQRPFTESSTAIPLRAHRTTRLEEKIYQQGRTLTISLKDLSKNFGVKYTTLRRLFYRRVHQELRSRKVCYPKTVGIDEFSVAKHHKYHTVLTDLDNHRIVETLKGRDWQTLKQYLKTIPIPRQPKAFVVDLWKPYFKAIREVCPQGVIIADKFHIIRIVNNALDKVRKHLQQRSGRGKKQPIFRVRYLLLKARERLTFKEHKRLEEAVNKHLILKIGYRLKEEFCQIYRLSNYQEAKDQLTNWCFRALRSRLPPFEQVSLTILSNLELVLNYFRYRKTNGYTEGINNRIKLNKRIAYGYRNFKNQRQQILLRHT